MSEINFKGRVILFLIHFAESAQRLTRIAALQNMNWQLSFLIYYLTTMKNLMMIIYIRITANLVGKKIYM
jgi:hypothetical protein